MKRSFAIFLLNCFALFVSGQNLVQNPSFENLPNWDEHWVLSLTAPSSATAVATQITTDAHEGTSSVELSNTVNNGWTYFYTDVIGAPIRLLANRSYEVRGWIKSVEEGKKVRLSIFWNGSNSSQVIYDVNPDPVSNPDWFMVETIITPTADFNDGYLSLGFQADKDGANAVGRLLLDDFSVTLIPDGTDADIFEFTIPGQTQPTDIDPDLRTVQIEMPFGTNLSSLAPDHILLSAGASIAPGIGEVQNFSSPVIYTVTAQDGTTTLSWTVTVTMRPPSTASAITSFTLPELIAPATISAGVQLVLGRVPYGTDVTTLVPAIEVSPGATIDPTPGVATDFTNPVTYIVVAENGSTFQDWVVAILVEPNAETDIISFDIPEMVVPATINNILHTVVGMVPFGTNLTALVPGIGVSNGATIDPLSGVAMDFSSPVSYTVTADDGTTVQDWTVTITEGTASSETDITSFTLPELALPATIDLLSHTVEGSVPYGIDLTSLVPTIDVSPGASINPLSGLSRDFSTSVSYTVTAGDGITLQDWAVTIQVLPNTETEIISLDIPELVGTATIDNALHTVVGSVPYGIDLTALVPSIVLSEGATIDPLSGVAMDFSSPVTYTVTAQDGTTVQDWEVTILVEPNTETDISEFSLAEQIGAATIDPVGHTVDIEVGIGTNLGFLTPIILVSPGATIDPLSGVSRDFTLGALYTVTAEDGITAQGWMVTVNVAPANTETDITSFSIPQLLSPAVIDQPLHTVIGTVPFGTDLTARVPTIAISRGATIDPVSGSVTDLSSPVTYTVTAEDGITTQDWLVSIQTLPNTETDITEFSLVDQTGAAIINRMDHTIEIEVASEADRSSLVPTISVSPGATVDPGDGVSQDFTDKMEYTVTAEDGLTTQIWTVTVSRKIPLGIGTRSEESIRIFPNPATEFIHIELSRETHVRLHDLMGKLCYSQDHANGDLTIHVSEFKRGIYIISLLWDDGSLQQRKLIFQ
jgi:hypothetical protein